MQLLTISLFFLTSCSDLNTSPKRIRSSDTRLALAANGVKRSHLNNFTFTRKLCEIMKDTKQDATWMSSRETTGDVDVNDGTHHIPPHHRLALDWVRMWCGQTLMMAATPRKSHDVNTQPSTGSQKSGSYLQSPANARLHEWRAPDDADDTRRWPATRYYDASQSTTHVALCKYHKSQL